MKIFIQIILIIQICSLESIHQKSVYEAVFFEDVNFKGI